MHPRSEEERYIRSFFLARWSFFGGMGMKKYEALVSKVFYLAGSTAILAVLGVFSFVSSTIPFPKSHATLVFATAYELVVMAKSTRMLVFILFHIIIVMICYGSSSKSEPELDSDELLYKCGESVSEFLCSENKEDFNSYNAYDESFEVDDDEERHGDLRRRIEEFIGSVTMTWKEELLKEKKVLCLVEDTESLYMLVPYEMV